MEQQWLGEDGAAVARRRGDGVTTAMAEMNSNNNRDEMQQERVDREK